MDIDPSAYASCARDVVEYFDSLISLIPVPYYFSINGPHANNKYWKQMKEISPELELKLKASKGPSALKPNDLSQKTVPQLIHDGFGKDDSESMTESGETDSENEEDFTDSDDVISSDNESEDNNSDQSDDLIEKDSEDSDDVDKMDVSEPSPHFVPKGLDSVDILAHRETLIKRLHEKLSQFQSSRKALTEEEKAERRKKKESIKKERALKRLKRKDEMRKSEQKEIKRAQHEERMQALANTKKRKRQEDEDDSQSTEALHVSKKRKSAESVDVEGTSVSFGRVQFEDGHARTHYEQKKDRGHKKSDRQLLSKLEREKKREAALANTPEGMELAEKKLWKKAFQKAEGEKVRDKAELLKKSIKRQEHAKKKSAAAWAERDDQAKKLREKREKARSAHIKERKQAIKDKKIRKLTAKNDKRRAKKSKSSE